MRFINGTAVYKNNSGVYINGIVVCTNGSAVYSFHLASEKFIRIYKKIRAEVCYFYPNSALTVAERTRFELVIPFRGIHAFQACLFNHSSTSPFQNGCKGNTFIRIFQISKQNLVETDGHTIFAVWMIAYRL